MSLGAPGGGILAGPNKLGPGLVVTIPATTWTEIVLQDLTSNPRIYPRRKYSLICLGNVFVVQANHSLRLPSGSTVTLPANPATPQAGDAGMQPGCAFLLGSTYVVFEAERNGENSLWVWSAAGTTAYVTNLFDTPFSNAR